MEFYMSTQKIFLSLLFITSLSTFSIHAAKKDLRKELHTPDTIEHLLSGKEIIPWLESEKNNPLKAYIIIHLFDGIITSLLCPDKDLIAAMEYDEELRREIEEENRLFPLYLKTLYRLLENNEHIKGFKANIADILFALDLHIMPLVIDSSFKETMNKIYFSLNQKITHETVIAISKDIEKWACRFGQAIKDQYKAGEKEEASSSPEELAQERSRQEENQKLIYDQEYGIYVYPDFYTFWLNPEDAPTS